jgi:hypothetical protein
MRFSIILLGEQKWKVQRPALNEKEAGRCTLWGLLYNECGCCKTNSLKARLVVSPC